MNDAMKIKQDPSNDDIESGCSSCGQGRPVVVIVGQHATTCNYCGCRIPLCHNCVELMLEELGR